VTDDTRLRTHQRNLDGAWPAPSAQNRVGTLMRVDRLERKSCQTYEPWASISGFVANSQLVVCSLRCITASAKECPHCGGRDEMVE
jgi:hypothetical protein